MTYRLRRCGSLCLYVHWRAQARPSIGWALAVGVVFGLALETKLNAWFLPFALVPHAFFVHRQGMARALAAGRLSLPTSVVSMAVVGPLVFYALWPYLWNDTFARVQWYVEFHLHHEYYNMEFLGKNYFGPPSPKGYLPLMVLATVPAVTLLLFGVGVVDRAIASGRRVATWAGRLLGRVENGPAPDPLETDLLLFLSFAVAVGPFFLPATPIFGGTKHWLPAYPVLALVAGRGFDLVVSAMRAALPGLSVRRWATAEGALVGERFRRAAGRDVAFVSISGSFLRTARGGHAGGADLGLNRQFWGFTSQNAAEEYLNAKAPRVHPCISTTRRGTAGVECGKRGGCGAIFVRWVRRAMRLMLSWSTSST